MDVNLILSRFSHSGWNECSQWMLMFWYWQLLCVSPFYLFPITSSRPFQQHKTSSHPVPEMEIHPSISNLQGTKPQLRHSWRWHCIDEVVKMTKTLQCNLGQSNHHLRKFSHHFISSLVCHVWNESWDDNRLLFPPLYALITRMCAFSSFHDFLYHMFYVPCGRCHCDYQSHAMKSALKPLLLMRKPNTSSKLFKKNKIGREPELDLNTSVGT